MSDKEVSVVSKSNFLIIKVRLRVISAVVGGHRSYSFGSKFLVELKKRDFFIVDSSRADRLTVFEIRSSQHVRFYSGK